MRLTAIPGTPKSARRASTRSTHAVGVSALVAAVLAAITLTFATGAGAAQAPVGLGTAANFAVLAGTTVTNTGPSLVGDSLGVSPGSAVTGFPPGIVSNGTIHAADAVAGQAKSDLTTAYNDAAGRAPTASVSAELGGLTLTPGVYSGGALQITGTLTFDAQGDPNAVFIVQTASTLITASGSKVNVINGARACNAYWKIGSSATLGTSSTMVGNILALTSITGNTGAVVDGRLLARNGAVTLDSNTIMDSTCAVIPTTTTTIAATTTTTLPTATTSTTLPGATTTTTLPGATTTTTLPAGTTTTTSTLPGATTTSTLPAGTTTTTLPPATTTTTLPPATTTTTVAPATTTTTAPAGRTTTTTAVPRITTTTRAPNGVTTTTTVPPFGGTTTTLVGSTTTTLAAGVTTTTAPGTTTGAGTTTTTGAITTGGEAVVTALPLTGRGSTNLAFAALALIALGLTMAYAAMRRPR